MLTANFFHLVCDATERVPRPDDYGTEDRNVCGIGGSEEDERRDTLRQESRCESYVCMPVGPGVWILAAPGLAFGSNRGWMKKIDGYMGGDQRPSYVYGRMLKIEMGRERDAGCVWVWVCCFERLLRSRSVIW